MHAGIIFFLVILGSILFHIFTPWYWTYIASNWKGMDDTITLTFWVGGGVFVAVCLFMIPFFESIMIIIVFNFTHKVLIILFFLCKLLNTVNIQKLKKFYFVVLFQVLSILLKNSF